STLTHHGNTGAAFRWEALNRAKDPLSSNAVPWTSQSRYSQSVRLADFILAHVEPILAKWCLLPRSMWPEAATADPSEVRDEAEAILHATVLDMHSAQTDAQQAEKSKGARSASDAGGGLERASSAHGAGRFMSGFDLSAVIAEYRALRASVLRLWRE